MLIPRLRSKMTWGSPKKGCDLSEESLAARTAAVCKPTSESFDLTKS
jgi:hypothetical protein